MRSRYVRKENLVPPAFITIVNVILNGSFVPEKCSAIYSALRSNQMMMLNYHETEGIVFNKKNHNIPLPGYIGLSLYERS